MKIVEYLAPLGTEGRRRMRHIRVRGRVVEFWEKYREEFLKEVHAS